MKRLCTATLLMCVLATPAIGATVYLKDGGVIRAKSVWRSKGMVMVLVNRDTLAEFHPFEIDMRRTFVKRHRAVSTQPAATAGSAAQPTPSAAPNAAGKPAGGKGGVALPKLPTLPMSLPEKSPPSLGSSDEGAIRKHKREMSEKAGEALQ